MTVADRFTPEQLARIVSDEAVERIAAYLDYYWTRNVKPDARRVAAHLEAEPEGGDCDCPPNPSGDHTEECRQRGAMAEPECATCGGRGVVMRGAPDPDCDPRHDCPDCGGGGEAE